jgi:hypothetical protein
MAKLRFLRLVGPGCGFIHTYFINALVFMTRLGGFFRKQLIVNFALSTNNE